MKSNSQFWTSLTFTASEINFRKIYEELLQWFVLRLRWRIKVEQGLCVVRKADGRYSPRDLRF